MLYTPNTKKALNFIYQAHKGQMDKAGVPYVFHPFVVATSMDDEDSTIVALLHDVIEDTEYEISDIKKMGFSTNVLNALLCLTHLEGESYDDYINKISANKLAIKVKLADLRHNSDLSRLNEIKEKDLQRCEKYKKYIDFLSSIG